MAELAEDVSNSQTVYLKKRVHPVPTSPSSSYEVLIPFMNCYQGFLVLSVID